MDFFREVRGAVEAGEGPVGVDQADYERCDAPDDISGTQIGGRDRRECKEKGVEKGVKGFGEIESGPTDPVLLPSRIVDKIGKDEVGGFMGGCFGRDDDQDDEE